MFFLSVYPTLTVQSVDLQQIATLTKSNNDLQIVLKNHKESFHKVQRKLRLVVSERDCYKQLIENYEKNVTSKSLNILIV